QSVPALLRAFEREVGELSVVFEHGLEDCGVTEERDHNQVTQDWDGDCGDDELTQRAAAGNAREEKSHERTPGQPKSPEEQCVTGHPFSAVKLVAHGFS